MAQGVARRRFDMRELRRVGLWGLAATSALVVAAFVATSESGERRLTRALADFRGFASSRPPDSETRKLAETIRSLTADRDALAARLGSLERNVGEITGSIARAAATPPSAPPSPQPLPAVAPPEIAPAVTPPTPAEPGRPEFGIDLGGAVSVAGLRAIWTAARTRHGALLDGLRPVIAIRETGRPGGVELRLVAGPLGNAAAAARLCSAIAGTGTLCQPSLFDGQRLALR
jgi:hypothetical protein